ncbi:MAG: DUF2804 domain-containing protein [Solirubrobacteraceae bacterium]
MTGQSIGKGSIAVPSPATLERPWRGPGAARPSGIPLPPGRMPAWRGARLLKRWHYVGVYGPDLMLCAGTARIGPARQAWWAVWDRDRRRLYQRTRPGGGGGRVRVEPRIVAVHDSDVEVDLRLEEGAAVEVVTPDPGGYAWTRKDGAATAHGSVRAGGRAWGLERPAFVDVSAGYHPRRTSWRWSAGHGTVADGRTVAWNLVEGVHDSAQDSERTLWVEGQPSEIGPVRFAADLSRVEFSDGGELAFHREATRRRDDNLVLIRSRYEQPFGAFAGRLPGGLELAEGYGVMERHDALW